MDQQKQILVLESERLLAAAVFSLLVSRPGINVTNTTFSALAYLDEPGNQEPDIIILDEELLEANLTAVLKLVDRHPKLRLIVLGLGSNELHIFDKHVVEVKQISDFFELL